MQRVGNGDRDEGRQVVGRLFVGRLVGRLVGTLYSVSEVL